MLAITLDHISGRRVVRISKARARTLYMHGTPVTCTDGVPSGAPTPRDSTDTAEDNFRDYANSADFYATQRVLYWTWA